MITNIRTKNFKGFDINEAVHDKTIYTGKNKSGKSSRSHAIALTILGYVPFAAKTSKIAGQILNDFGVGDSMTTAIVCNGVEFERHFSRNKDGAVSQRMRVDKKKVSAADYAVALSHAGNPRIVDVNDFMQLSDQKKIDLLFNLFPPDADLKNLESKIDKAKQTANELQAKERTLTSVIQRLTASKSEIQLPAGSLPEIRARIEKLTKQVKDAQENLKQIEIDEAKIEAAEKAKNDERERANKAALELAESTRRTVNEIKEKEKLQAEFDRIMESKEGDFVPGVESSKTVDAVFPDKKTWPPLKLAKHETVQESIQKIIDTMKDAGCEVCAGLIVAKMELNKFK
jgi:DNA repair protein SbcC/Rad50